jgi:hypothetical protein
MFAYQLDGAKELGRWRTYSDMFNSPPLAVTSSVGAGATRLFVTSTLGGLYAFDAANVGAGPVWVTRGEVAAIPTDDLPQSTYCYITLTPQGTLLVTASAGGADWSDEKAVYAIVNGAQAPPVAAAAAGPGAALVAGLVVAALAVSAAGGGFAYFRVPAFRSAVDGAVGTVKGLTGGRAAYRSVTIASEGGAVGFTGGSGGGGTAPGGFGSTAGGAVGFNSGGYGAA